MDGVKPRPKVRSMLSDFDLCCVPKAVLPCLSLSAKTTQNVTMLFGLIITVQTRLSLRFSNDSL